MANVEKQTSKASELSPLASSNIYSDYKAISPDKATPDLEGLGSPGLEAVQGTISQSTLSNRPAKIPFIETITACSLVLWYISKLARYDMENDVGRRSNFVWCTTISLVMMTLLLRFELKSPLLRDVRRHRAVRNSIYFSLCQSWSLLSVKQTPGRPKLLAGNAIVHFLLVVGVAVFTELGFFNDISTPDCPTTLPEFKQDATADPTWTRYSAWKLSRPVQFSKSVSLYRTVLGYLSNTCLYIQLILGLVGLVKYEDHLVFPLALVVYTSSAGLLLNGMRYYFWNPNTLAVIQVAKYQTGCIYATTGFCGVIFFEGIRFFLECPQPADITSVAMSLGLGTLGAISGGALLVASWITRREAIRVRGTDIIAVSPETALFWGLATADEHDG
ncbi:hypothetical protein CPB84DRAFT_1769726 [Gymnopilus junonius]|uniref:Uncharacterized protein n=1 Tax=Gymnopilus junonius TaxID=109634 RepID=A0A9P5NU66_GYMJU|nr:hypothetical protein CPB84DRAFT_1769726 [Gymnopilus junonius]